MKRLPQSLSVNSFRETWKTSRDSKSGTTPGAPGVDGVRAAVFASQIGREIIDIRRQLQEGAYRFNKLRLAPVPKASGGHRIIAVPTVRDRLLQRTLLRALEADNRFNASSPIAYGFTKGRTLADAQRAARSLRTERPWVLQADIVKFFDNIERAHLEKLIRKMIRGKTISRMLCEAIHCEIEDVGGKGAELVSANGIQKGVGLRQGMPVSPMLSNLLLKNFDGALAKRGIIALRYADDIAVFGETHQELVAALAFIRQELDQLKLKIPELEEHGKTTIRGPSEIVEFLGVEVLRTDKGYTLAAPMKKIAAIEKEMAAMASLEECIKQTRNIGHVVRSLDAFIIGYRASMAVLDVPNTFFDRIEAAKQRQLRNFLIEIIGKKAADALDDDRRAVLGLRSFS